MAVYSSGALFLGEEARQTPEFALFEKEAEGIAVAAARAGSIDASLSLANAYSPLDFDMRPPSGLRKLVKPSIESALYYYYAAFSALSDVPGDAARVLSMDVESRIDALLPAAGSSLARRAEVSGRSLAAGWTHVSWSGRDQASVIGGGGLGDADDEALCAKPRAR